MAEIATKLTETGILQLIAWTVMIAGSFEAIIISHYNDFYGLKELFFLFMCIGAYGWAGALMKVLEV